MVRLLLLALLWASPAMAWNHTFHLTLGYVHESGEFEIDDLYCNPDSFLHANMIRCDEMFIPDWPRNPNYAGWNIKWEYPEYRVVRMMLDGTFDICWVRDCHGIKRPDFYYEDAGIDHYAMWCLDGIVPLTLPVQKPTRD